MRGLSLLRTTLLACLLGAITSNALALSQNYIWLGGTLGETMDWGTTSNWNPNSDFPGNSLTSDTATFDSTGSPKMVEVGQNGSINPSLDTLNFSDHYTLNIDNLSSLTVSGLTTLQSGILLIGDASHPTSYLNGDVYIDSGATLSGFGSVNNLDNNGTIAPGDASTVGSLTLHGDFTAESGSVYQVNMLNNTASNLTVNGDIDNNANSTILINPLGTVTPGSYDIVDFTASINNPTSNFILSQPLAFDGGLDFSLPNEIRYVFNGLLNHFVLSETTLYANQQFALAEMSTWLGSQTQDRVLDYSSDKPMNMTPDDPTFWLTGIMGSDKLTDSGSGFNSQPRRASLGFESASCNTLAGMAFAYTHFRTHAFTNDESARVQGNLYQLAGYGRSDRGNWRLGTGFDLGMTDDMESQRFMPMGPSIVEIDGSYRAFIASAQAQAAYTAMQVSSFFNMQPIIGLRYQWVGSNHFTEQGPASLILVVNRSNFQSLRSEAGLAFESNFDFADIHTFLVGTWEHEFADNTVNLTTTTPNLTTLFQASSTASGREALVTKAGFSTASIQNIWKLAAFYEGRAATHLHENAAKLEISYSF